MPREFFSASHPPARLMRFREKYEALARHGIDVFYCPRFSPQLRDISVQDFVRVLLAHNLNARSIVIGDDFRFAAGRSGSVDQLERASKALTYEVEQLPSVVVEGVRASSTAIRELLADGDLHRATALLGRPYRMSGRVVRGRHVGRELGFPTANVDLRRRMSPVQGIFAVLVSGVRIGDSLPGVASVGTRPTFDLTKPLLEVHLFDFDDDIYGEYIHVDFIAFLRDEEKFDSVENLVAQMNRDAENARLALAKGA